MSKNFLRWRNSKRRFFHAGNDNRELVRAIRAMQSINRPVFNESSVPTLGFNDFNICSTLKENISRRRYVCPTPIQEKAIPVITSGRDIIGIANTGTGKTAAFLLPLLDKVFRSNKDEKVLIITPTRELALQIKEELVFFARGLRIWSALCIGGMGIGRQKRDLGQNPDFVIGTPGRLKDLIREKALDLQGFNNVVLDEADRMVDIGFIADIKYFISLLPKKRQSLFFSATISSKVKQILENFVRDPVTVSVKQTDTVDGIKQEIIQVSDRHKKIDQLHNLLIQQGFEKILIFGRTKWGVQKLSDELVRRGFRAGAIHGNKRQSQRIRTLENFKQNRINILLATDVASRGLDIQNISHVINYDLPDTFDDYIHRIGRTGRANKKGVALTFME